MIHLTPAETNRALQTVKLLRVDSQNLNKWMSNPESTHQDNVIDAKFYDDINELFTATAMLFEAIGLPLASRRIDILFRKQKKAGLTDKSPEEYGPVVISLDHLDGQLKAVERLLEQGESRVLKTDLIEYINGLATHLRSARIQINREHDLQAAAKPFFKVLIPDLQEKPTVQRAGKKYFPDFGSEELRMAIELKYIDCTNKVASIIDEVKADATSYAGNQFRHTMFVVWEVAPRIFPKAQIRLLEKQLGKLGTLVVI